MYEGEIVQIGTPQELVENPEHKFVGYFIGSPGMNFMECTLDGNAAQVDGARIPLDQKTADLGLKARGKLELGIRPMYLELNPEQVKNSVPAAVKAVEDLGSYKIATLILAGKTLHAKLSEGVPVPNGKAWLVFPPQWVRLYADGKLVK
jgi:glycerol transport system ATP-binding protein